MNHFHFSRPSNLVRRAIVSVFFIGVASLPTSVRGQASSSANESAADSTRRWSVGSKRAFVGSTRLGLADLNTQLAANGRPTFANAVTVFGVAGHARRGRLLLGATAENALPESRTADGWRTRLATNAGSIDAGVAMYESRATLISPVVSLGVRRTSLRMTAENDFDYQDGLRDPARSLELSSLGAFARFGLAAEWRARAGSAHAFAFGIESGLMQPLGGGVTFANERSVHGAPRQGAGGYFRFAIGMPMREGREALGAVGAAVGTAVLR